ncbi:sigma-E processing peptidase SpoIIGA [Thermosyntropha sp.]|uniref:sigma-E processing peptidase SpoIIGA n=1 Tax=Thermosyntropha sp. TaxID=2740820 RepID=UPI0025D10F01|nr:sigma-E processing peptidase SpoIIGA [Thermosyntropha sp.]MBO8159330.1 sigma-E processing peptidase SpoIIGA [Thermosyntropha sp.]
MNYVYADITFIVNFVMDFFILWATAKLVGARIVYSRLLTGAFLGGIYGVGYLFPSMSVFYSVYAKILFSCLLLILGLEIKDFGQFKKTFLYFYGISFMAAGASMAFSYLRVGSPSVQPFSYLCLLGGILCILLAGKYGSIYLSKRIIPKLLGFPVKLRFDKECCFSEGFLDTGNSLRDPLTNKPVLVAEYDLIKDYLPDDFRSIIESDIDEDLMLEKLINSSLANRLRLIPFTSIGKKKGILIGIRVDEIAVDVGKEFLSYKDMVVGIYRDSLNLEGNYKMLIPVEMLQGA